MSNEFDEFVKSLPAKHWAKYDLAAVEMGWDARQLQIEKLETECVNAKNEMIRQAATITQLANENGDLLRHKQIYETVACNKFIKLEAKIKELERRESIWFEWAKDYADQGELPLRPLSADKL